MGDRNLSTVLYKTYVAGQRNLENPVIMSLQIYISVPSITFEVETILPKYDKIIGVLASK